MREEPDPKVRQAPLRDQHREIGLPVIRHELADDGDAENHREAPQAGRVARRHVAIDADHEEIRLHEAERLVHRREQQRAPEDAAIRADVRPQPPDQPAVVRFPDLFDFVAHPIASSSPSSACWRKRSG